MPNEKIGPWSSDSIPLGSQYWDTGWFGLLFILIFLGFILFNVLTLNRTTQYKTKQNNRTQSEYQSVQIRTINHKQVNSALTERLENYVERMFSVLTSSRNLAVFRQRLVLIEDPHKIHEHAHESSHFMRFDTSFSSSVVIAILSCATRSRMP